MGPVYLFDLASQQAHWLTARQTAVAENISNVNTPGYKMTDVPPFEAVFNDSDVTLAATNPGHLSLDPLTPEPISAKDGEAWEVTHSGNSVSLEQELMKEGEVTSGFSLNRTIVKAFNQMLMASLKG